MKTEIFFRFSDKFAKGVEDDEDEEDSNTVMGKYVCTLRYLTRYYILHFYFYVT